MADIYAKLQELATAHNVELTENAVKIAKFRERTGLSMDRCPCLPKDPTRGCISEKCLREIETEGCCHCHCFRRRGG